MLEGISGNKNKLIGKFIGAILKLEMNSEYVGHYDNMHLSYLL